MLADRIRMTSPKFKSCRWIDTSEPRVVVDQPYSTEGNGGRKLVRLENGWLVCAIYGGGLFRLYVSRDNGNTWTLDWTYITGWSTGYITISSKGTTVYAIFHGNSTVSGWVGFRSVAITTSGATSIQDTTILDDGQSGISQGSIVTNPQGTEIHACWSSKNSTYPDSFNIRYCKGDINSDGSVTWGSIEQITRNNSEERHYYSPCIVLTKENLPIIIAHYRVANINSFLEYWYFNSNWRNGSIYISFSHELGSPSACVDKDGTIHVVYNRFSATYPEIYYSKSVDGGTTWTSSERVDVGGVGHLFPTITSNSNGDVFITMSSVVQALGGVPSQFSIVVAKQLNGKWRIIKQYPTIKQSNLYTSSLMDNTLNFDEPLTIYGDMSINSVMFVGKWYECP